MKTLRQAAHMTKNLISTSEIELRHSLLCLFCALRLDLPKHDLPGRGPPHCPKMEMNEEKPSKFQFHFPLMLVPSPMKKKLSKKKVRLWR